MHLQSSLDGISPQQLRGFFVGWPNPPTPQTLHRILGGSYRIALAVDHGQVVGFVNAVSDGVLCAYIPLLEVRAEWQGQGIASALLERLFADLNGLYMIDTACDDELVPFYKRFGMMRGNAMIRRNYECQNGKPQP